MYPHLFPDGVVAEETAHLTLGQCAARVGVLVAREQVHTQALKDTAVECPRRHKRKWVTGTNQSVQRALVCMCWRGSHGNLVKGGSSL